MQRTGDVFRTGKYHKSFKRKHTHVIRSIQLRLFYATSLRLMKLLGWPDPLARTAPRALLCGSASAHTTLAFARFVGKHHQAASIDVLDISPYALSQSAQLLKTCRDRDIDASRVTFIEGDALRMPFADESFDWIETDFFIQFFSPEETAVLFREWYRVLKPGGVVTTRDWLMEREDRVERLVAGTKEWLIRHVLGPVTYKARAEDVRAALAQLGFVSAVFPVRLPGIRLRIPVMSYLLIHKPAPRPDD